MRCLTSHAGGVAIRTPTGASGVSCLRSPSLAHLSRALATGNSRAWRSRENFSALAISSGGVVTDSNFYIGAQTGSSGIATLTGSGSRWNIATQFFVGDNGQGALYIQNGDRTSHNANIGYFNGAAGEPTVTGTGSQLNDSGVVTIGSSGQGKLSISHGGIANNAGGIFIGNGIVTVVNSGSQWNTGFIEVGAKQHGALTITNSGVVNSMAGDRWGVRWNFWWQRNGGSKRPWFNLEF